VDPGTSAPPHASSARRKGRELGGRPSAAALAQLQSFAVRSKRAAANFPESFVRDESEEGPPLARILRGGRSGAVRLKLLLSMLKSATRESVAVPSTDLAQMRS
jgi:hypothetical protein